MTMTNLEIRGGGRKYREAAAKRELRAVRKGANMEEMGRDVAQSLLDFVLKGILPTTFVASDTVDQRPPGEAGALR